MSKERELLKRWLAGEANQIPTHVPLLIETQNLLAQPEHSEKGLKENISQMAVEIYREGFKDGVRFAENHHGIGGGE